jgi:hypothetical protein
MTKESLAAALNGLEYPNEPSKQQQIEAKQEGLLIIFGASDDLCELRGAINDEAGAWNGADILISDGKLLPELDRDDEVVLRKHHVLRAAHEEREKALRITAKWCLTKEYSWTFETKAPHAVFDIMEDGDKFCRGIVIDLKECQG